MSRILGLKLLYVLAGLAWAGYESVNLLASHTQAHLPISIGTILCVILFVAIPASGYVLLFVVLPWASRLLRR